MPDHDKIKIRIVQLPHSEGLSLPDFATSGSAGMDISAAIKDEQWLKPSEYALIPSGIAIALPAGYEAQIRPRSGLALKYGITCLNSPGTIDSDYRGEIKILLINLGKEAFLIKKGDRIAQLVLGRVICAVWEKTDQLDDTPRGVGGFASTGVRKPE